MNQWCKRYGGWVAFTLIAAIWIWRLLAHLPPAEHPVEGKWGLTDFRDLVYYPPRVLASGVNPYDVQANARAAPVGNIFPLYSPLLLLLNAPFSALPLPLGQCAMCALNLALSVVLAAVSLRCAGIEPRLANVGWLAALVLLSQPGRANFNWGQIGLWTSLVAIGGAHLAQSQPRWAALGIGLATLKPTIGLPLAWLLFCRGWRRPAVVGAGVCCVLSVAGVLAIFALCGDLPRLATILAENQKALHADPTVNPQQTLQRVDANTLPEFVLGSTWANLIQALTAGVVFGGASVVLLRAGRYKSAVEGAASDADSANLALLSVTVGAYHLVYDALVIFPAVVESFRRGWWGGSGGRWERISALLLLVPLLSTPWTDYYPYCEAISLWLSGAKPGSFLQGLAACLNSLCLLGAWGIRLGLVLERGRR